jgi:guanine nucleotide-binding protein G(i) subunit alpha
MMKTPLTCTLPSQPNAEKIMDYRTDSNPAFTFSEAVAEAIHQLWKDPVIPEVMDHSSEFYLMDNAS